MQLPYSDTDDNSVQTYNRVHANGEQTHVAILSAGEDRYVAVAYDIDPVNMVPVAAECVAYDPTIEGVGMRARRWMEQHPKGVMGSEGGGGWGSKLNSFFLKMLKKMDEYGNQQMNDLQEQQEGEQ